PLPISPAASRPSPWAPARPQRAPRRASTTSPSRSPTPSDEVTLPWQRLSSLFAVETTTVERPRSAGPDSGLGGNWMVIVENDNHNTFDHVAKTLARVVAGISLEQGHRFADTIHNRGRTCCGCRRSEEHTSELQSQSNLVCRLL